MPNKNFPPQPVKERRSGVDRRRVDLDVDDRPERRRGVEARKPDVIELEMTRSEWLALSTDEPVEPKAPARPQRPTEQAR